jgi:hypothetical protein
VVVVVLAVIQELPVLAVLVVVLARLISQVLLALEHQVKEIVAVRV